MKIEDASSPRGSFINYVDNILAFFDHLPPCVDIFYGMNVDKKWTFYGHLPTYFVLWTTPSGVYKLAMELKENDDFY